MTPTVTDRGGVIYVRPPKGGFFVGVFSIGNRTGALLPGPAQRVRFSDREPVRAKPLRDLYLVVEQKRFFALLDYAQGKGEKGKNG
jgi:hypothetical protein